LENVHSKDPNISSAGDLVEVSFGKGDEAALCSFVSMEGKENGLAGSGIERVWGERSGGTRVRTEGKGKGEKELVGTRWKKATK
jgi:hypothetical protein